ncbi:phosphonate transport system substrate-binding protein [Alteromonadaceae bacterium 2753L.S.0a.02]|nr:phosphonate transport system substrate-binding protein [Alteromonadaceae bacterium 2753L.S.0a.02]
MIKKLIIVISCLISALSHAQTFTFTAIPDEDESRLVARFSKVASYLEKELNVEVRYIPVKSYAAAVTAFRNNQVQLAWFGGLSGVQARLQVPGSQALAQGFEDQLFKSYFIAHHSAGLKKSQEFPNGIQGKTFTFGSKGSTSGRLMPEYYIRENFKKSPDDVFKRVGFSGDHSMTIAQVQAGAYQVGVVNYLVWETELAAGKIDESKVSVIWETPQYPDYQWTIRGDADKQFGADFTKKVQQALLSMSAPELLASFPRKSFIPATNADYQAIEDTAKTLQIIR